MISQTAASSKETINPSPFNENGFLPLITFPSKDVVDENNYKVFLDNKIQVCLPKNIEITSANRHGIFISVSLEDFKKKYIEPYKEVEFFSGFEHPEYICITNINIGTLELHEAIRKAKEIHGDNLVIMTGGVGSVEVFIELAKTGVDYIRVGINPNITANTGVGYENLEKLIKICYKSKYYYISQSGFEPSTWFKEKENLQKRIDQEKEKREHNKNPNNRPHSLLNESTYKSLIEQNNLLKVKIVADHISTYVKQCEKKYGFSDNGYAAINKLLLAGADLVMVKDIFTECIESAALKGWESFVTDEFTTQHIYPIDEFKYRRRKVYSHVANASGGTDSVLVKWSLKEWLHGASNNDGWIDSITYAMKSVGKEKL